MLWPPTISFELHAEMAEEIDLEKCTFRNFGSSVTLTLTLTLDRVKVISTYAVYVGLPAWTYGRTDVRTDGRTHRRCDDLKIGSGFGKPVRGQFEENLG